MKKEKSELIQEALDTLQAVTLSGRSVESYVAELFENIRNLEEENKKLKERINTMQEFIDYSEGVVQNAIGMLYEEGGEDKALDYLENCYVTGDDKQYEEMERLYKNED